MHCRSNHLWSRSFDLSRPDPEEFLSKSRSIILKMRSVSLLSLPCPLDGCSEEPEGTAGPVITMLWFTCPESESAGMLCIISSRREESYKCLPTKQSITKHCRESTLTAIPKSDDNISFLCSVGVTSCIKSVYYSHIY